MREATEAHEALQRELATVCTGRFEPYRHRLAIETADTPELVSGRDLIGSNRLEFVHEALARERDCADQRAVFSLWVRMYGDVVIPAVLVANLVLDRDLPLSLDETRFAVDPDGKPRRLVLAHAGDRFPPDIAPAARFTRLIEGNLGPVVEAVSRQGRVSPRLLWGSLASYFEWTAHVLTTFFDVSAERFAPIEALFGTRQGLGGATGALVGSLRQEGRDARGLRWRRVCCIRYLIPAFAGAYCANCPIRRGDDGRAPRKGSRS